jgi:hypothetical protein
MVYSLFECTGHEKSLKPLLVDLALSAECAVADLFIHIVSTEIDEKSGKVLKMLEKDLAQDPRFAGNERVTVKFFEWTAQHKADIWDAYGATAPKCTEDDHSTEGFGKRVLCYFEGNPMSTWTCDQCMHFWNRIWKGGKTKMAKKVCDGHNYVDYATTDASLK